MFGSSNGAVLDKHRDLVVTAVVARLNLLSEKIIDYDPVQLVQFGYCDPVRLFVKQEPHSLKKITEGRFRLISSVSLVDQLVERMIFGPQNELEITRWRNIPSKPGMGLSLEEQAQTIWSDLSYKHLKHPAAEADISGFDWSVQDWELWADLKMRIELGNMEGRLKIAAINRFTCFMNSVFQLSDGSLIAQGKPGLMKSGSYCTSSTNSRIRCLMAELIGAPWCIAMGDDSVEGYVPNARRKYEELGHVCKDYMPCKVDSEGNLEKVNFCSHELSEGKFWLTSWPKTVFRYLNSKAPEIGDLKAELWGNPHWGRIYEVVGVEDRANKILELNDFSRSSEAANYQECCSSGSESCRSTGSTHSTGSAERYECETTESFAEEDTSKYSECTDQTGHRTYCKECAGDTGYAYSAFKELCDWYNSYGVQPACVSESYPHGYGG